MEKHMARIKKVKQEKDEINEKIRKSGIGQRYDKEKLKKVKPPTFLHRKEE